MTNRRERIGPWVLAADIAVLCLLAVAAYVLVEGGFIARPLGLRLAIRSTPRVLLWASVILAVRHFIVFRPTLPEWIVNWVRDMALAAGHLREDDVELSAQASTPGPASPQRRHRLLTAAGLALFFAGLTVFMTYPQVRNLDTGVSPDIGDPLFSTWRISWVAHQIVRDPLHLFDGNIFHPTRYTLAFSDAALVPALTVVPLIWLGVPQLVAYNLLLLSGFALSGIGMFVLVRSLTGQIGAALVAGFVFAFLPYRYMHYAHLELQMAQWMPLCLWAFHRTLKSGRLRDGVLTGLFFALQTLSSIYYGLFFATFMVPFAAVLLIAAGRDRAIGALKPLLAGAALAGVLVAPLAFPYTAARQSVGERPLTEIAFYSATPQNYLAAHRRNDAFGLLTEGLGQQERELFQGFFVPVVALVGLWPPMSAARIGYLLATVLAFEVSLGLNGFSYEWLHAYVPPYRGLRVPARMAMLVGLSLSILVGYGVARITARRTRRVASVTTLAIALLIFAEYRSTLILGHVQASPPPVYQRLRNEPPSVLMELPLKSPDIYLEPVYMYYSTFHWHTLVNGYSGFSPPSYARLLGLVQKFPDEESIAELRRRDVDFIIVHGALYERQDEYQRIVAAMDRRRDFELIGVDPWQGKDTRLYRMLPRNREPAKTTRAWE